jgi:hypothetical protein
MVSRRGDDFFLNRRWDAGQADRATTKRGGTGTAEGNIHHEIIEIRERRKTSFYSCIWSRSWFKNPRDQVLN